MDQDISLVDRHKKGDRKATELLIKTHQAPLYGMIFRLCRDHAITEDLVQDAFIRAFERIEQFEGRSSFRSWLTRIGINLAKNYLTSYGYRNVQELDENRRENESPPNQEDTHARKELQTRLRALVDKLPPKQKLAVMLRIFEEMSFNEIAAVMKCPFDTAKANYRHGIQAIKKIVFHKQGGLAHELRESMAHFN